MRATGVSNNLILENFKELMVKKIPVIVRIPLIPDINDSEENITETASFIRKFNVNKSLLGVELLPYHRFGVSKLIPKRFNIRF